MPVDLQFSENKRYLVYNISDPMQMTELYEAYRKEKEYRDSVQHTVHSIVDMSGIKRVPTNWLTAKAGPGLTHPRSGSMLFVGISPGLKILLRTIMQIARYERMKFFDTRAEADAYMADLLMQENRTPHSPSS